MPASCLAAEPLSLQKMAVSVAVELKQKGVGGAGKAPLAVLDFPYYDGKLSVASVKISEALIVHLAGQGVAITERKLVEQVLREKKLEASGAYDERTVADLGKLAGAGAMITGTVEDLDGSASRVNLRVVDSASGVLLLGKEYIIARDWEKRASRGTFDGKVELAISFEPEQRGIPEPPALSPAGERPDFSGVDMAALEKYDALLRLEKRSTDYAAIAVGWDCISRELPQYRDLALKRAEKWRAYSESRSRREKALSERAAAAEQDYARLSKMLAMEAVTPAQKSAFALKYAAAYGPDAPHYASVREYLPWPCTDGKKAGFCNHDGSQYIPAGHDNIIVFSEGLAVFRDGDKRGYIGADGGVVIGPQRYEAAGSFSGGLAKVKKNGRWGFIDRSGKLVVPAVYEEAGDFSEGLVWARKNGKWGYIDTAGAEAIPFVYDDVSDFRDGSAIVKSGSKYGLIDRGGWELAPVKYDSVFPFQEGLARVELNRQFGFMDRLGREVLPAEYEQAGHFSEGLAAVKHKSEWSFIDRNGQPVIPLTLPGLLLIPAKNFYFSEGLAALPLDLKNPNGQLYYRWDFIDKTGAVVVRTRGQAGPFIKGTSIVDVSIRDTKMAMLIGRDGMVINRAGHFERMERADFGLIKALKDGKWQLLRANGEPLSEPKYDSIGDFDGGMAEAAIGSRKGYLDRWGRDCWTR